MRIISSFHDYYDTSLGYGIAPKLVYLRERKELVGVLGRTHHFASDRKDNALRENLLKLNKFYSMNRSNHLETGVVFFCGKVYPFCKVSLATPENSYENKIYYSLDKLAKYVEENAYSNCKKAILEELQGKTPWWHRHHEGTYDTMELMKETSGMHTIPDSVHRFFESPVLLLWSNRLLINPILRAWNFQSVVDPFTAFQELSMYVGNNLVVQKDPNVNVSDKIKAETHGFDEKSFRRKISKKKRRK